MRTQWHSESLDPAQIAAQVRAQFGPHARVVRAERVRTSRWWSPGVREHVELTIEVPDPTDPPPPAHPDQGVDLGVDELLAAGHTPPDAPHDIEGVLDDVLSGTITLVHTTTPIRPTHDQLRRAGVPEHLIPATDPAALSQVTRAIVSPPELPKRPGDLIVAAGPRGVVDEAAKWLGGKVRTVRISDRGANRDPGALVRWAGRNATGPLVVALQVANPSGAARHARKVIDDLAPACLLVAVDARWRNTTAATWVKALGDKEVTGLAATRAGQAQQPAAVLALGHPVVLLDGHLATPSRWAEVLAERLTQV